MVKYSWTPIDTSQIIIALSLLCHLAQTIFVFKLPALSFQKVFTLTRKLYILPFSVCRDDHVLPIPKLVSFISHECVFFCAFKKHLIVGSSDEIPSLSSLFIDLNFQFEVWEI